MVRTYIQTRISSLFYHKNDISCKYFYNQSQVGFFQALYIESLNDQVDKFFFFFKGNSKPAVFFQNLPILCQMYPLSEKNKNFFLNFKNLILKGTISKKKLVRSFSSKFYD